MEVGLEADVVCRVAADFACFLGVSGFNNEFTYWRFWETRTSGAFCEQGFWVSRISFTT